LVIVQNKNKYGLLHNLITYGEECKKKEKLKGTKINKNRITEA